MRFRTLLASAGTIMALGLGLTSTAAAAPTSGFVARNGTELVANGQPWKFAGYNLPCANPFDLTDAQLQYYLDDIQQNSGANVLRMWFFQSEGGPGNWTNFDRVIGDLKSRGMRAILTLTNQTSTCDEPALPPATEKTLSWYQSGYTTPEGGYTLSYRDYVSAIAAHYANEPTVAFWQLVNEAAAPEMTATGQLTCDNTAAMQALRSFSDDMVGVIRSVDPNHLVDLGTEGSGQCGTEGSAAYQYVHAGALDLCEYHDYGQNEVAMPGGPDGLAQRVADCHALGKPIFVGESGIPANVQPDGTPEAACSPWPSCSPDPITITTLNQRASFFRAKIQAGNQAGLAGYVLWVKSPFYSDTTDAYAIADGDPAEAVVRDALAPYPSVPVATTPEVAWAALLPAGAVLLLGGWAVRRRRLARLRSALRGDGR